MYEVIISYENEEVIMPAVQYQRLLRKESPSIDFETRTDVPLKDCTTAERVSTMGSYMLHVARLSGWSSVTISGEAAHLLDTLIDSDTFLHGTILDFGTLLRTTNDPLTLDQAGERVQDLKKEVAQIADIAAAPVTERIFDELRKKFPLDSPTKQDKAGALAKAIDETTKPTLSEFMRQLSKRLKQSDVTETPSDSEDEQEV